MLFYYFFLFFLGLSVLIFYLMYKGVKTPVNTHDSVPSDLAPKIKEITFPSVKSKDLYAWYLESKPDFPTLILVHGWGRNVERMIPYVRKMCCRGFNILAFDARGHGNSHTDGPVTMLKFTEDIGSAIKYIMNNDRQKNKSISLIGLSIGGASSILAASRDDRIKKVVTVGAFAHPLDIMRKQMKDRYIPYYPFTWLFFKYIKWRTGINFEEIAPINNINKAKADFLLIHGTLDTVVPLEQGLKLKNAQPKVHLWEIIGRGHSNCHLEPGFWDKIEDFLKNEK